MSLDIDLVESREISIFSANVTHNLNRMADKAGIYQVLWRAPENKIFIASQLIQPLQAAVKSMKENPDFFRQFDAENGWGAFEQFLPWIEKLLTACINNPNAKIKTSR